MVDILERCANTQTDLDRLKKWADWNFMLKQGKMQSPIAWGRIIPAPMYTDC